MANINVSYMMFEETIQRVVQHFNLKGKVVSFDILHLYVKRVCFDFNHHYLNITDYIDFSYSNIDKKTVLYTTVEHLKEIEFQFHYYFNPLWC
jgi:hypothetical protein